MTTYLIVGVEHATDGNHILSRECACMFREHIVPRMAGSSLLLMEGSYSNSIVPPDHPVREPTQRHFHGALDGVYPSFGSFDTRFRNMELSYHLEEKMYAWDRFVWTQFEADFSSGPSSLDELVRTVTKNPPVPPLKRGPSREEIALAEWTESRNRRFDDSFIGAMRKYGRKFDTCVAVTGNTHAISMAKRTGYEGIYFVPGNDFHNLFYSYLAQYVWPTAVRKMRAAT